MSFMVTKRRRQQFVDNTGHDPLIRHRLWALTKLCSSQNLAMFGLIPIVDVCTLLKSLNLVRINGPLFSNLREFTS